MSINRFFGLTPLPGSMYVVVVCYLGGIFHQGRPQWRRNAVPVREMDTFFLVFIVRMRDLSSPIVSNISSFVLCSVQLTFSILLQVHISKASSRFISSFLIVHVSAPYSTTLHIGVFIIRIFNVCLLFLSKVLSSLRMLLFLLLFFF